MFAGLHKESCCCVWVHSTQGQAPTGSVLLLEVSTTATAATVSTAATGASASCGMADAHSRQGSRWEMRQVSGMGVHASQNPSALGFQPAGRIGRPSLPSEKGPEGLLLLSMFRPLSHFTLSWSKDCWVLGRESSFS